MMTTVISKEELEEKRKYSGSMNLRKTDQAAMSSTYLFDILKLILEESLLIYKTFFYHTAASALILFCRNFKSQSVDGLNSSTGSEREWSIPVQHVQTAARPEPEGRSIGRDELLAGNQKLQRTLSNASEKARMQGFSYLFPQSPVVEELPVRRAKTPTPLQEQVFSPWFHFCGRCVLYLVNERV